MSERFTAASLVFVVICSIVLWQAMVYEQRKGARERDLVVQVGTLVRIDSASKSNDSFLLLNAGGPVGLAVGDGLSESRVVTTKGSFVVDAKVSALHGERVSLREWNGRNAGNFLCIEEDCYKVAGVDVARMASHPNVETK